MEIQAAMLTGGASTRMGEDKATLLIDGVPQARRIADALLGGGIPVTVLGREPLEGCDFLPDRESEAGPLAALAHFAPSADYVFLCSCDLPRFDVGLIAVLREKIGDCEVAVPEVNGWRQPLCALYRRSAFEKLAQAGSLMRWLDDLDLATVSVAEVTYAGLDPRCVQGANTKDELSELLEDV